jgi:uncharacterized YccA/Bax inhibitor family protein
VEYNTQAVWKVKDALALEDRSMNLTLIGALTSLALWLVLVFGAHLGNGPVHILWAVAAVLFARRIMVGAPKLLS